MGKHDEVHQKVVPGTSDANITFHDVCAMLKDRGFSIRCNRSSRHIFSHPKCIGILNLQPAKNGEAKPYQVKEVAGFSHQQSDRMNQNYSIALIWSTEDQAYIARVMELPGCFADGATAEEAVAAIQFVIEDWIDEAKRLGRAIPPPMTTQVVEKISHDAAEQFRQFILKQVDELMEQAKRRMQLNPALATYDPADFWKREEH